MSQRAVRPILVTSARGKTGRRIAERLTDAGIPVRAASRSSAPAFDWSDRSTWPAALAGVRAAYIAYQPDLAVPGALSDIAHFVELARSAGVEQLVLLSGRGEVEAEACEQVVQQSGLTWTVLRASWFFQNFSESFIAPIVEAGAVYLPVGAVQEPFVDCEDIADVALATLRHPSMHAGQVYELTGPRLLTFGNAISELAEATGRDISFTSIPMTTFEEVLLADNLPSELGQLMRYLFTTVLDGRNASLTDGVQRALGRAPRDFRQYAQELVELAPNG